MAELFVIRKDKFLKALGDRFYLHAHTLILLGSYEFLLLFFANSRIIVFNGVDIWFKFAKMLSGWGTFAISIFVIAYSLYFVYCDWLGLHTFKERQEYLGKRKKEGSKFDPAKNKKKPFKAKHKFWLYNIGSGILIGFACGSLIIALLPYLTHFLFSLDGEMVWMPPSVDSISHLREYHTNGFQNLALALGAGFYDEWIFRKWLDSWLRKIVKVDRVKKYLHFSSKAKWIKDEVVNNWILILLGAAIFSVSHYLFPYGDVISPYSFLYRIFFGIIMYWIYIWSKRNFGIIAWTHAFYDLWYFITV